MREIVHDVLASETRAQDIIQRMRPLLSNVATQFRSVEVGEILRKVTALAGSSLHERGIAMTMHIDPQGPSGSRRLGRAQASAAQPPRFESPSRGS